MHDKEIWKPIPHAPFNQRYHVSNHGRIKRLDDPDLIDMFRGEHITEGSVNPRGYAKIGLRYHGEKKSCQVHRLVALTFLDPPGDPDDYTVNHIDGDKLNNHVSNLEWCTQAENVRHACENGLHARNKLDVGQVREIKRRLLTGESQRSIAEDFPISQPIVSYINQGKIWADVEPAPA